MSNEQLDAVKDQLLSDENSDLRQKVLSAYLEEPERGANMIIAFATDKGLKLDATSDEVIDYLTNLDNDDIDIEMSPEMLATVSGGWGGSGGWSLGKLSPRDPKTPRHVNVGY